MVSTEDMVPTLAEVCGLELPAYPLTGVSFARALEGRTMAGRDMVVCTESTRQATIALRTPKWKLVQPIAGDSTGQALPDIYGEARPAAPQLFDLEVDPRELHDVAPLYPQLRDEMAARLQLWREEEVMRRGGSDPLLEGLSLPYDDFRARLGARKLRG
jgi:arylsulfatase